jgi:excisionase family DNA binding protein
VIAPLIDAKAAGVLLGVSVKTVRRLVERDELKAYRVAGRLRFDPADVERYLQDHRVKSTPRTRERARRGRLKEILDP